MRVMVCVECLSGLRNVPSSAGYVIRHHGSCRHVLEALRKATEEGMLGERALIRSEVAGLDALAQIDMRKNPDGPGGRIHAVLEGLLEGTLKEAAAGPRKPPPTPMPSSGTPRTPV